MICRRVIAMFLLSAAAAFGQQTQVVVHCDKPGTAISPSLYGIFFEEINHAGEGGLYAELVRNRTFKEQTKTGPGGWSTFGTDGLKATLSVETSVPLNSANPVSGKVDVVSIGDVKQPAFAGVVNGGYWGMSIKKGETYRLSFYARGGDGFDGNLTVAVEGEKSQVLAKVDVSGVTGQWKKFTAEFQATDADPKARLAIGVSRPGTFYLNLVSLFPEDTYRHRVNGMRKDLAEMVEQLHPAFMRFPGGCYVEGSVLANRFDWKKSIGDVAERPGHANDNWHYWSTDGLGYHEYLQFCEDIGAAPMYVFNVGMSHRQQIPMDKLHPFVDDAVDAIEYANGPVDSKWGSQRARNGHPGSFHLKYVEIGNENGMFGNKRGQWGGSYDEYLERYKVAYGAIKATHPEITCVANTRVAAGMDFVDDHVYEAPTWFWNNARKYDDAPRGVKPDVYVGEYADTKDCGQGNLRAALAEAAYMNGFERNGDVVRMSSYAPMFVQVNDRTWNPDMMVYDSSRCFGTPSYWVQRLYAGNRPTESLPTEVSFVDATAAPDAKGTIGLATWDTQAEFKNVAVQVGGKSIDAGGAKRLSATGDWAEHDGVIAQTGGGTDRQLILDLPELTHASDYTLTLKARKTGGAEGFIVMFRTVDKDNYYWWNLGGWGNTETAIEKSVNGTKTEFAPHHPSVIETGRWYDVKVELHGDHVRCSLDGKLIYDATDRDAPRFTAIGGKIDGGYLVKVVNGTSKPVTTTVKLDGTGPVRANAEVVTLSSGDDADENSLDEPNKIVPKTSTVDVGGDLNYTFKPYSLTLVRLLSR